MTGNTGRLKSGSGMGLSLVRSFIELHRGTIEITETGPYERAILCLLPRHVAKDPDKNMLDNVNDLGF